MITVRKIEQDTFEVTVENDGRTTHTVTLSPADYNRLTGGQVTPETLIEKSFEFLLERESNTSILRSFDLPEIGRYFPDYEQTIKNRLKAG